MIAYAGLRDRQAARGVYAKLLATGLTSLILCQATLNIFAVLGLAPLTGVPLPFISYGLDDPDRAAVARGPAAERRRRRVGAPARGPDATASDDAPQIVIAAGGTAGHVVPALAVADALRADGAEVVFIGGERAEAELVPAAGYELARIRVEGLSPHEPAQGRCARRVQGRRGARARARLLRAIGADAVMGGGGYVAGPVGLAAVARAASRSC